MQISTKGRYALRIMLYLADRYTLECVSAKHIAEEEKLSVKYLEHIMSQLSKNGFVVSEKGAAGGYRLAEAPVRNTIPVQQSKSGNCFRKQLTN